MANGPANKALAAVAIKVTGDAITKAYSHRSGALGSIVDPRASGEWPDGVRARSLSGTVKFVNK